MNKEIFDKLRQPIKDEIIKWFKEHEHEESFPCRYCTFDKMWLNDECRPIHKCLKSGKNDRQILSYALDETPIIDFVLITDSNSELKNDLFWQYPENDKLKLRIMAQKADSDDYVCLHFNPRPDGKMSLSTDEE